MTQLDLFGVPIEAATAVKKAAPEKKSQKKEVEPQNKIEAEEEIVISEMAEVKVEQSDHKSSAYPIMVEPRKAADTSRDNIVFENSNIGVKIKARQDGKADGLQTGDKKPAPRKSIVVKQQPTEFSIALNDKLSQVKNSIKEGLLKDTAAENKKKKKEERVPQKRGRKSLKELDVEADLVEVPDDDLLFKKQYYSISEVAGWFKVNTSLLRFWENEFDILKPRKNRKGDRMFRPEDVKNIQLIYQLLRQRKFSIEGAKEFIKSNRHEADKQLHLVNTLQKFRNFLLELKANL